MRRMRVATARRRSRRSILPCPAKDLRCSMRRTNSATCGTSRPIRSRCPPLTRIVLSPPRSCGEQLTDYLDEASEDELINEVLLPLFRHLGFHKITAAGHRDKALEYGKDVWMKYTLPTQHVIYFGLQAKKDKIDAAAAGKGGTANIAEIHNQVLMMIGHEIFDRSEEHTSELHTRFAI